VSQGDAGRYTPGDFRPLQFIDSVRQFADGGDSPRDYLERCLATIDEREAVVRAWVTLNIAGARAAADASTQRYKAGQPLSPIDGMPIGIKDVFETKDRPTQMGCSLFAGNQPNRDCAAVHVLRDAGAIILGKTVTTELAWHEPGPTTNPFDDRRTPGGSSSGSAAAVGARMIPVAIGSQVGGSVIRPASYCANYAIKPTLGALNHSELYGLSQNHLGIHAGSLRDMWSVAKEIGERAGGDPGYPALDGPRDLPSPVKPMRLIAMETEGWSLLDDKTRRAFERFLESLRAAGIEILCRHDDPLIEVFERSIAESTSIADDICNYEIRWALESLEQQHPNQLSESLQNALRAGRAMNAREYRHRLDERTAARRCLAAMAPLADALVSPASIGPAPLQGAASYPTGNWAFNASTSNLGAPTVAVPMLAIEGLPVGVQVVGQRNDDARVVGIARWISESIRPIVAE
jgi:Asp-tRNA(Asn)/Glu-tRNA(Gln) amidotransferase A subunit family amidase